MSQIDSMTDIRKGFDNESQESSKVCGSRSNPPIARFTRLGK